MSFGFAEPDVALPDFIQLAIKNPRMICLRVDYDAAVQFLLGFNAAHGGSLFEGFKEWLVVLVGKGNNLMWYELALYAIFPCVEAPRELLQDDGHEFAIERLLSLFAQFSRERDTHRGLFRILLRHQQWLENQEWYQPGSAVYVGRFFHDCTFRDNLSNGGEK